jgi:hypothetical protein
MPSDLIPGGESDGRDGLRRRTTAAACGKNQYPDSAGEEEQTGQIAGSMSSKRDSKLYRAAHRVTTPR